MSKQMLPQFAVRINVQLPLGEAQEPLTDEVPWALVEMQL
jgi:hypothetical protein